MSRPLAARFLDRGLACAVALSASVAMVAVPGHAAGDSGRLIETGSSLLYPLFNLWIPAYQSQNPKLQITSQSTGSGAGMSQAASGLVQIGASDAYMSPALLKQHPNMLNIPLAISSQMVNYNVPGLNDQHIKLSGPVLAAIYQGRVKTWDDPALAKLNPGLKLPSHPIVPIHRTDGSGDTFIFTQFLAKSDSGWGGSIAYGTTVTWPSVPDEIGAVGNAGMVQALQRAPYSIAYVGISFKSAIQKEQLGEAMLQNKDGQFVLPTSETVVAAASAAASSTPADERIILIYLPGAQSYPIINYEYAVVSKAQPNGATAKNLRDFLGWAISADGGNASHFLDQVSFVPLPDPVRALSQAQIAKIGG